MRKIMNHFTKLSKCLENENDSFQTEMRMFSSLSILAELIKLNPKVYFPFTRKFLNNLFLIDENCLLMSPYKQKILAILGVLFENLSRQIGLLAKYELKETLKKATLQLYCLIDEVFTLKVFNRVILNLVEKGVMISSKDLADNYVLDTLANLLSLQERSLFMIGAKIDSLHKESPVLLKCEGKEEDSMVTE